jgi:hypothetical protein
MIGAIVKVQKQIVNHEQNQSHISHALGEMNKEIKDALCSSPASEELVNQLTLNFEIIDKNTLALKQRIQFLE